MSDDTLPDLLAKKFIQRRDVKAIQRPSGHWEPDVDPDSKDYRKFTRSDLRDHVAGRKSFGHYLLDEEGNCKLFAFDIDLVKTVDDNPDANARLMQTVFDGQRIDGSPRELFHSNEAVRAALLLELRTIAEGLSARVSRILEIPTAIAYSGSKGLHVYGFTGTAPGAEVRAAATDVILTTGVFNATRGTNFFRHEFRDIFPHIEIEVFPKQDSLDGKKLGNLMRLPLGRNLKGGNSFFVDPHGVGDIPEMDAASALEKGINWK